MYNKVQIVYMKTYISSVHRYVCYSSRPLGQNRSVGIIIEDRGFLLLSVRLIRAY